MARFTGGWIKLHRELLEKDISENINLFGLWNYLLLIALYKESQIIWNGEQRILKPGSCLLSVSTLGEKWGLCKKTIFKWLRYLEKTSRIVLEVSPHGTVVTICNWERFQVSDEDGSPLSHHQVHTGSPLSHHQVPYIKKVRRKELKKERNIYSGIRNEYSDEFHQLWIEYGRRGDKSAAYAAFLKLNLSDGEMGSLKKAIGNYCQDTEHTFRWSFSKFLKSDWREFLTSQKEENHSNVFSFLDGERK